MMGIKSLGLSLTGGQQGGGGAYTTSSVVAVGDSITEGAGGVTPFPVFVATAWGGTLDNNGVSGTVLQNSNNAAGSSFSGNLTDNFEDRSITPSGQTLLCAYGFNDGRYTANNDPTSTLGYPYTFNATEYKTQLISSLRRWLVRYGRERIWIVTPHYISDTGLLNGVDGLPGGDFDGQSRVNYEAYVTACRDACEEFGVRMVDTYAAGAPSTTIDSIHPDADGVQEIVAQFDAPSRASLSPTVGSTPTTAAGEVVVPSGITAYRVDGALEELLTAGIANGAPSGSVAVVFRAAGNRWEQATLTVPDFNLASTPYYIDAMTINSATSDSINLTGAGSANRLSWFNTHWVSGTRIQCTITTSASIRVLLRSNIAKEINTTPNETLFDQTFNGTQNVDYTLTQDGIGYFGFLTLNAGDIDVTGFTVTPPA
jgi:lysophospholipase L1-like esterase